MYRGNVDGGEEDRFNGSKMTVAMEHKRKSSWDSKVRRMWRTFPLIVVVVVVIQAFLSLLVRIVSRLIKRPSLAAV